MATFRYTAKNQSGNSVSGLIDAETASLAASKVREMGFFPLTIDAVRSSVDGEDSRPMQALLQCLSPATWFGISASTLLVFFRQMSVLLASGMTVSQALRSIQRRQTGRLAKIVDEMACATASGETLSSAMERHRGVFSGLQVALVKVGESSGLLQEATEHIALYLEYDAAIRRKIARAVFYPLVLVIVFLLWQIAMGVIQGGAGGGIAAFRAIVIGQVVPLFAIMFMARFVFQFRAARMVWDFVKTQVPWIGSTARKIALSRFCRALALLHSSGVPVSQSLATAADASGNLFIGSRIRAAVPAVVAGQGLTESLEKTGAVSHLVLEMLATGEKAGNLEMVLQKAADYLSQEVDVTLHKVAVLAFVVPLLLFSIRVGLTVLSFYSGQLSATLNELR